MASSYTSNLLLELVATGEQDGTWGSTLNTNDFTIIDTAMGGRLSISVAGSSNVTPSDAEARNFQHTLIGTLTGNIDYIVPNRGRFYSIYNNSSGAFSITVKPSGGTGIVVPQGSRAFLFANPTTGAMEQATTAYFLPLAGGTMTGDVAFGGSYKLTGLAAGASSGDSVRYEQAAKLDVADQTITGGARVTPLDLGTISSGTTTPDPGDRPLQYGTVTGNFTLAPGANNGAYILDLTISGGSVSAITTSGWTKVTGGFTYTNGDKFRCYASISNAGSLLQIVAMQ